MLVFGWEMAFCFLVAWLLGWEDGPFSTLPALFLPHQTKALCRGGGEPVPSMSPGMNVTSFDSKVTDWACFAGGVHPARLRSLCSTRTSWPLSNSSAALMSTDTWPSTRSWRAACPRSLGSSVHIEPYTRSSTTTRGRVSLVPHPASQGSAAHELSPGLQKGKRGVTLFRSPSLIADIEHAHWRDFSAEKKISITTHT